MNIRNHKSDSKQPTLMQGVLLRIFATAMVAVMLFSVFSYFYAYQQEKEQRLDDLREYVADRVKADSVIFELAEDNLAVFKKEYLRLYLSDVEVTEEDFWELYFEDEEGATRMKKKYFDGVYTEDGIFRYAMSSFIGNNQSVADPDFQRRLVLTYRLLSQVGPAWVNRFANVHASFPENGIVLFWPEEPWGLNARADLPMNELGVIKSASQQENPERMPLWSGLYFDETAEEWVITYQVPIDYEGKHLINPSHDVYLTDLMERLVLEHPVGGYNFLIRKDGYLIAHPSEPSEEQRWVGELSLDKVELPAVVQAYELITEQAASDNDGIVQIIENKADKSYLVVGELSGPDWWFVSVLPTQVIQAVAHHSALISFIEGLALVLAILAIVYMVIRHQAEQPLAQLRVAADLIGRGEYDRIAEQQITLPLTLKNEIGLLARRFVEMAANIGNARRDLENIVEERTRELAAANEALEQLSLTDGLMGIRNRRSFDQDLARLFEQGMRGEGVFTLILADVDHFKSYNDKYGHAEGDRILKEVSKALLHNIRDVDRVYRYGGEEIAILLTRSDENAAVGVGERMLESIRALRIPHEESEHGIITISAGLASFTMHMSSSEVLIKEADRKLYEAKSRGRNQLLS